MIGKLMYGALGLVLCAATVFTGDYGLSAKNQNIYHKALHLQTDMEQMGFENLQEEIKQERQMEARDLAFPL